MEINLLAFGIAREIMGSSRKTMTLEAGTTVGDLRRRLVQDSPGLSRLNSWAIAVNSEYAADETVVKAGDEVAVIPPVSGG